MSDNPTPITTLPSAPVPHRKLREIPDAEDDLDIFPVENTPLQEFGFHLEDLVREYFSRKTDQLLLWLLRPTPWRLWSIGGRYRLRPRSYEPYKVETILEDFRSDLTTDVRQARKAMSPRTDPLGRPLHRPTPGDSIIEKMTPGQPIPGEDRPRWSHLA
jgi:hypothetical protein